MAASDAQTVWDPLVYFWDGGWIGIGPSRSAGHGPVPPHAHHAVQVSLGLDGPLRIADPEGTWHDAEGAVVTPNVTHQFDSLGASVAMLFLDPECREGRWLRASCRRSVEPVPRARFEAHVPALLGFRDRRPSASDAGRLLTEVVHGLCEGPPPLRALAERIGRALAFIRAHDARGLTLDAVAKEVFLSPSRFAHLFTAEVGLPFRRYLLWRKLNRAMDAFSRGSTLSAAAHAAGFADSAHLTRTFHQMFGIPPSVMMGSATFYEIPAPFEL